MCYANLVTQVQANAQPPIYGEFYRIPKDAHASATFLCKADGVLAGTAVADAVFAACDPAISVTWHRCDGDKVSRGEKLGSVAGNARAVLRAERIALNFMQVCSHAVGLPLQAAGVRCM